MSWISETVYRMTAILGYARVSTTGQDLDAQLAALALAGVEGRVFTDKLSGSAKTEERKNNDFLNDIFDAQQRLSVETGTRRNRRPTRRR